MRLMCREQIPHIEGGRADSTAWLPDVGAEGVQGAALVSGLMEEQVSWECGFSAGCRFPGKGAPGQLGFTGEGRSPVSRHGLGNSQPDCH